MAVCAVCAVWAVVAMKHLNSPEVDTGGYGGFVVIAAITLVTPIGLLCGDIGLIGRECPAYLSWLLVILTPIPIIGVLAKKFM